MIQVPRQTMNYI